MSVWGYALLVGAVLIGGTAGLAAPQFRRLGLPLVLAFSGAYLLGVTCLHVLPEAFATRGAGIGLALLAGFFAQLLLESLSQGVEHGHVHAHGSRRAALPVLVGLSLHAFLEGTPLDHLVGTVHEGHEHGHLLVGLALHKVPAAFALAVLLTENGYSRGAAVGLLLVFAAMSPLGSVLAKAGLQGAWLPYLLALVAGSLLHVSTTILFEQDSAGGGHRLGWRKLASVVAGFAAAIATAGL